MQQAQHVVFQQWLKLMIHDATCLQPSITFVWVSHTALYEKYTRRQPLDKFIDFMQAQSL